MSTNAAKRSPRQRPTRDRPFRLNPRDTFVLESVGKMRFVTTSQLARLAFAGSRWAANKRLRKLLDADLVRVWVRNLAQENVYSLERAGGRLLSQSAEETLTASVPRSLDGNLEHLLAINQVRIAMATTLADVGGEIASWIADWDVRTAPHAPVLPDALFTVAWADRSEQTFTLEMERESRSPRGFLRKALGYQRLARSGLGLCGFREFQVLVVCRDRKWLNRYQAALAPHGLAPSIWFATLADVDREGANGRIWLAPAGGTKHSLRGLGNRLYGKEGATSSQLVPMGV